MYLTVKETSSKWDISYRRIKLLVNLELMKAGYPPIDIKFCDRVASYNAFGEYHIKRDLSAMESLFAKYINKRLDTYLKIRNDMSD